ncbi:sterol desaturase family protein [Novosphingobium sp. RL4]|uniref:sterol desaturase family protein n=1 Tax=Novosphingobium sp. RL4 TaxID=3109595 RepID=UPI002D796117|nr:sterol desaturase family protein [Novosphingobium sp. RL4]WRT95183.1 sterol desaturase family protein [Novosphingobium sp. RL4]
MGSLGVWILGVTAVILVAELVAGRHRGVYSRSDWFVNGICIFVGAAIRPLGAVAVAFVIGWLVPSGKGALSGMPFWPAVLAIVLVAEFANYWVHRLSHQLKGSRRFDWLWRMHRTHHTAKYVNVLLNFRISLFWSLVAGLTWAFSLALYLGLAKPAVVAIALFSFWGIFTHSDFRWDITVRQHPVFGRLFRALEHVIVSPGMHHSHHGYGKDGGNYRNFGILLSIYDWMFGTLYIPEGRPFRYGIPGATPHWADDAFSPFNVGSMLGRKKASDAGKSPSTDTAAA